MNKELPANLNLNIWSLFSGIGGLEKGLEDAGLGRTTLQCEIDPFAQSILNKHWPLVPVIRDVKEITADKLKKMKNPDLICGGFPCQPHSVAGKRKGTSDERHLWPEFARIIEEFQPTFVVAENVPNIRRNGALAEVLSDLADCGYDAEWIRIGAAAVGAPHLRERIFIVAYPGGERRWENTGEALSDEKANGRRTEENNESRGYAESNRSGTNPVTSKTDSDTDSKRRRNESEFNSGTLGWKGGELWDYTYRLRSNLANESPFIFTDGKRSELPIDPNETSWECEPDVGRVANGVPKRVDRLRALGNAVVPQVAQFVGECIYDAIS